MKLTRDDQNDTRTYGTLYDENGAVFCQTLELPDRGNAHGVSCIPVGTYRCVKRWSPKHGTDVFGVDHVPDRSDIEIHAGNTPKDSLGCILLGTERGQIDGVDAVLHSRVAVGALMAKFHDTISFTLEIV